MVRDSPWVIAGFALSAALLAVAWFAWRRRGAADGLRWLAVALVPAGLAMSGLGAMFGRIGLAIGRFFTMFVFSPFVWTGLALLAGAVGLELASRAMRARGVGARQPETARRVEPRRDAPASSGAADDDLADIEELLRRRGIT